MADASRPAEEIGKIPESEIAATLARHLAESTPPLLAKAGLTKASVLIPFIWQEDGWQILFTRRTERVQSHKGQVSFPGGSVDPEDDGPDATALRETHEEIGVAPDDVKILGRMPEFQTFTGFQITPVVGVLNWPVELKIEEAEVSRVFTVPLAWMAAQEHYELRPYQRPNGEKENVVFFNVYDEELVWGVTGRIMLNLIHLLKQ